jgi:hypothetical protein
MANLVAWRTVESLGEGIDRAPRQWLTVGQGEKVKGARGGAPGVKITRALFVLEDYEAGWLGVDIAEVPEEPVWVSLKLELGPAVGAGP